MYLVLMLTWVYLVLMLTWVYLVLMLAVSPKRHLGVSSADAGC